MNILAFDTCLQSCSVAVLADERLVSRKMDLERGHAEQLMPMIRLVLDEAQVKMNEIHRIAVTCGPGSFTGVRIGVAAARGLALATGAELVTTNTLHVLAAKALERQGGQLVCVAVDARRDQIYFGLFDQNGPIDQVRVLTPDQAAGLMPRDKDIKVIGSGRGLLLQALNLQVPLDAQSGLDSGHPQPDAAVLARLAISLSPCTTLSPLYLRAPDAKPQTGKAVMRSTGQ